MILSLSRYGRLNMSYMESLTSRERDSLVENLITSGHKGVQPHEIGDVRDCKTFDQRRQLFEKVREGSVREI